MSPDLRLDWRWLVGLLLAVVLFVPPRRYEVPAGLPFELDPYRVVVFALLFAWLLTLLSERDFRWRWSGLEGPLAVFGIAVVGSLAANLDRVALYEPEVVKVLSVLLGYAAVFYLAVNVLRTRRACETALAVLVLGGAVLGVLAIVEQKLGWSPFVGLDRYLPFVQGTDAEASLVRDGRFRAFGSAEHPIAFGALLAMLAPVATALAVVRRKPIWVVCLFLLVIGSFATGSRTPVLMLLTWAALFTVLRWQDAKRFIPHAVVALVAIHFVMPGVLGSLRESLRPTAVVEQQRIDGSVSSAGRIADIAPSLQELEQKPLFGYGVGTRIVTGDNVNARILDNQWLASLLDMGIVGAVGLAWLLGRYVQRLALASYRVGEDGALLAALASAILAYGVGMATYDALSFTQVTLVVFVLLAVGSSLVLARDPLIEVPPVRPPRAAVVRRRVRLARVRALAQWRRRHVSDQLQRVGRYTARNRAGEDE